MKVIRMSRASCDICGKNWKLSHVELDNGDKILKCFHCNRMKYGVVYDIHRKYLTVTPIEPLEGKSKEEIYNRCVEIMSEF